MLIGHSRVSVWCIKLVSAGADISCGYRGYDQDCWTSLAPFVLTEHTLVLLTSIYCGKVIQVTSLDLAMSKSENCFLCAVLERFWLRSTFHFLNVCGASGLDHRGHYV